MCLREILCNIIWKKSDKHTCYFTINKAWNRCLIPSNLAILPLFQKILFLKIISLKVFFIYFDYILPSIESYFVVVLRLDWKKVVSIFYYIFKTMTFLKMILVNFFLSKVAWFFLVKSKFLKVINSHSSQSFSFIKLKNVLEIDVHLISF